MRFRIFLVVTFSALVGLAFALRPSAPGITISVGSRRAGESDFVWRTNTVSPDLIESTIHSRLTRAFVDRETDAATVIVRPENTSVGLSTRCSYRIGKGIEFRHGLFVDDEPAPIIQAETRKDLATLATKQITLAARQLILQNND